MTSLRAALPVEVPRFLLAGAANTVLDVGLFTALRFGPTHTGPVAAKVVSITVAAVSAYLISRFWVWQSRPRQGMLRQFVIFAVLCAIGLVINDSCVWISHDLLGWRTGLDDEVSANVVGLLLATWWRYWSFNRWVFPPTADLAERREALVTG